MKFQEEEKIVHLFSNEIKQMFFADIPEHVWKITKKEERNWTIGVSAEQTKNYPYLYHLEFDHRNKMITFHLIDQNEKTIRLFPHIYVFILTRLKEMKIDCFVRVNHVLLHPHLYKKEELPLHSTHKMSKDIYLLLQSIKEELHDAYIVYTEDWNQNKIMQVASTIVKGKKWEVEFIYDESVPGNLGCIKIEGNLLQNKEQVKDYFEKTKEKILLIQKKEREIMDYLTHLYPKSYYDPHTHSMVIFQKNVPFSVGLFQEEKTNEIAFGIQFGSFSKTSVELEEVVEEVKKHIHEYVIKTRLRAVVEGRT